MNRSSKFAGSSLAAMVFAACASAASGQQQQSMGSLPLAEARVTGSLEVDGARATLLSNVALTAYGKTATIALTRGGSVQVCATSGLHLLHSGSGDSLLFALDHGAAEIRSLSRAQDIVLTPDIRFSLLSAGTLDLRLRVTPEGDTCVDNHGSAAPALSLTEAFGSGQYRLTPGQHVLFEHGSLRAVVDKETSACGCPPATPVMTASGVRNATSTATPGQAAALNPFPAAESAGLVATPLPLDAPAAQTAVEGTLRAGTPVADAVAPAPPVAAVSTATPAVKTANPTSVATEPPASPPGAHAIGHSVGNFFRRLFGRKPQ